MAYWPCFRQFFVAGIPAPQGSKRHVGNGRMIEVSKRVKPWRRAVAAAAREHCLPIDGSVLVSVSFYFPRPQAHWSTVTGEPRPSAPKRHTSPPDLDKLLRSTLDGLTGAAFHDDAQVQQVHADKSYLTHRAQSPGAWIVISTRP